MLNNMTNSALPFAPNTWKVWIDFLMRHRASHDVRRATLVRQTGVTASATAGFLLSQDDVTRLNNFFAAIGNGSSSVDRIYVRGKTYMVKQCDGRQLVAFNGTKYLIVSRSRTMMLAVRCNSRSKQPDAAKLVRSVNAHLIQKNF